MPFQVKTCIYFLFVFYESWKLVAQSCPTLCDPVDCSLSCSSVHGILQARVLEWVAISFSSLFFNWRIITLQYCHISIWIGHKRTCVPSLPNPPANNPTHLPPHAIPPGCQSTHRAWSLGANSHWLSVLHMVTYIFQCYSLKSSHPLLLPLSPKVCSLCLCLLGCPACRIISILFLDSIYMH